ncbi:MAG: 1-phosphofructokinase [Armatimonadetes bacterium]|nr:1-phosphofructokinase [Armatimonadota bacterium]
MVITVTLNAAVDKTYTVQNYTLDRVHRPSAEKSVAGGKGINVARVLHTLGRDVLATGFVGGYNGDIILSGLDQERIPHDFVRTGGESRICIAVVDPVNGTQTEVNENGPEISPEEVEALESKLQSLLGRASFLILSGSAPPGVPGDFYVRAIRRAKAAGVRVLLDSSGEHFRAGAEEVPDIIKPNVAELSAYVGSELLTVGEILNAAKELTKLGIGLVVISMGRSGALATDGRAAWQAAPPEIEFVSAVGSGDALVAAVIDALLRGESVSEALKAGTAAGAANAMVYGAGFCSAEAIASLEQAVRLVRLE